MNNLLLREITEKKKELKGKASEKELLFYRFLSDENESVNLVTSFQNRGEIDQICYAAFVDNSKTPEVVSKIERMRSIKPIPKLHFSKNLISVIACSLVVKEIANAELKEFFQSALPKERYIVRHLFNEFEYTSAESDIPLERVIRIIIDKDTSDESFGVLKRALMGSSDLLDIFIIEQAYEIFLRFHPSQILLRESSELVDQIGIIISKVESRVSFRIDSLIVTLLIIIPGIALWALYTKWTDWNLEPITVGIPFLIWTAGAIFFIIKKPDFKYSNYILDRLSQLKKKLVAVWFNRNGVKIEQLKEIIGKLHSKTVRK